MQIRALPMANSSNVILLFGGFIDYSLDNDVGQTFGQSQYPVLFI